MAMQLSSQSFPVEMREHVVLLLKTWADFALEESAFDIFKLACKSGLMIFILVT